MGRRRGTAAAALLVFAVSLCLAVLPYHQRVSIGRLSLAGRCPSAVTAGFTRVPEDAFFDFGSGEDLPAELCGPSARRRLMFGAALTLVAGAIVVGGRTSWHGR
jgi:hypothetical protein